MTIREACTTAFIVATNKGFHERSDVKYEEPGDARYIASWLMLVVTEVAEACEELRKGGAKSCFADELADICIRVFDIASYLDIDLEEAIELKMKFNTTRPHRHGGKRL